MKLRAPAIPLIDVDPFFAVFAPADTLNEKPTMHWTGAQHKITGIVSLNGEDYCFLGACGNYKRAVQTGIEITPLETTALFSCKDAVLKVRFVSPFLLKDMKTASLPVTYITVELLDGACEAYVKFIFDDEITLDYKGQYPTTIGTKEILPEVTCVSVGAEEQRTLSGCGDDYRISWGNLYVAAKHATAGRNCACGNNIFCRAELVGEPVCFAVAYDEIYALEYFGKRTLPYYRKYFDSFESMFCHALQNSEEIVKKAREFSHDFVRTAKQIGGAAYEQVLSLAYRQAVAAHTMALDENGMMLFVSKECFSNGCAATVDITYPSIPLFLIYNTEYVKGMLRPVFRYANSEEWPYDFAPHDCGCHPLVNGQAYAGNKPEYQMPVEECGNMLITCAAVSLRDKDASFAMEHIDLLEKWCSYCIRYGKDPEYQLCTDDFAGRLAHNVNLAIKATMAIASLALIYKTAKNNEKYEEYIKIAREYAAHIEAQAINDDGTLPLAFDQKGTFSLKYNMVWDVLFETGLFSREIKKRETASYIAHRNRYGTPLDSRANYSKVDWLYWCAVLTEKQEDFEALTLPVFSAFNESGSRVPMTDWYSTESARARSFRHRSVVGGVYMKMLHDLGLLKNADGANHA